MTRERLSFDGLWDFRIDGGEAEWRRIAVPRPWQSTSDDLRHVSGTGIYRRDISVPAHWEGDAAVLCFGAVNYFCEVLVDGELLVSNEGGWLPFEILLPDRFRDGRAHELTVRATVPEDDPEKYPEFPFNEIPHGKQSWYGKLGGIWQSVRLERRRPCHIISSRIDAAWASGTVSVRLTLSSPTSGSLVARVIGPDGTETTARREVSGSEADIEVTVEKPRDWSPWSPSLYTLELSIGGDSVRENFGFRTIETRGGQILLNGGPIIMRGALDQDYYPETIMTPPSLAFLEDQFSKAKAMGFNCLRCHIKVPDPRYYDVADRLGMLIWTDVPNFERFTPRAAERLRDTLAGIVLRDGNHPSIIAWTIINEDWGTQLERDATQRVWLAETYDWLKALDPTRLVVDNSPCWPNFHIKTDLDDFHWYYSLPDHREGWDAQTAAFCDRAAWSFSPHGDARRRGDEPLVVSEFGNWGLPHLAPLLEDGREPWWFETGHERHDGAEVAYPHGVQARFSAYHLDAVFGSFEAFVAATQRHQFAALKYEIESLRARSELAGYVVTELTDLHWEANGVMDMRRNPRDFAAAFGDVNSSLVIVPSVERWAFVPGERIGIDISVASGDSAFGGGNFLCGEQTLLVPNIPAAGVRPVGRIEMNAPSRPGTVRIDMSLAGTKSFVDITVLPARDAAPKLSVWAATQELAERVETLGYARAPAEAASVLIAEKIDEVLIDRIWHGARVLVLADDESAIPFRTATSTRVARTFPGLRVMSRDGNIWRGASTSAFNWLARRGAFAAIPGGPLLDFAFERVVPRHVLVGFRTDDWAARVMAGLAVGWVHRPAATIGARFFGTGGALFSTFRLTRDDPGVDPMASALLDALIATAARLR